jgi:transcriptional regulator with XRE-family HTH domain
MISMKLTLGEKFRFLRERVQKDEKEVSESLLLSLRTYKRIEDDFIYPKNCLIRKAAELYGLDYDGFLKIGEE